MSQINKIVELQIEVDGFEEEFDDVGIEIMSLVEEPAIGVHWAMFAAQHLFIDAMPGESEAEYLGRCIPKLIGEGYDEDQAAAICYAGFEIAEVNVDNKGFEKFATFFEANQDLFSVNNTDMTPSGGMNHKEMTQKLEAAGVNVGYPFGFCYPISQFMFYMLDGYEGDWDLKCAKKMGYTIGDLEATTTHWFIQHKENNRIIDLTASQFEGLLDVNEWYPKATRANLGFPYYNIEDGKRAEFDNTVPSLQVLKIYDKWREDNEVLPGLEKYWKAAKYEKLRKKFTAQDFAAIGFWQFEDNTEMVDGIIDLLNQVEDLENRMKMAHDVIRDFGKDGIVFDMNDFMRRIGFDSYEVNTDALPTYVDETGDLKKKEDIYLNAILEMASQKDFGQVLDIEATTYVNLKKSNFETIGDYLRAIDAIDTLTQISDSAAQQVPEPSFRYTGRLQANSRDFCRAMIALGKIYTKTEIDAMSRIPFQPGMGPGGTSTYNIFNYKGGVNCQHYWEQLRVFKGAGGRNVVISEGPAAGDAGEIASSSNNEWRMSSIKKEWAFAEDDDKRIITGPAMKAFQLIPRRDEAGNLFHVYFTEETIKKLSEKFLKEHKQHMTDIDHSMEATEENTLIESWIVEDPQMDKSKALGFNPTKGDWYVSYKINNEETWNKIKAGKLNGFSIAGQFLERNTK